MAKLFPCDDQPDGIGGFVVEFPSGIRKQVAWRSPKPIVPTIDAAKQYAAGLIEHLSREARFDDMERTNWPSMVAGIQKLIGDWNDRERLRQASAEGVAH